MRDPASILRALALNKKDEMLTGGHNVLNFHCIPVTQSRGTAEECATDEIPATQCEGHTDEKKSYTFDTHFCCQRVTIINIYYCWNDENRLTIFVKGVIDRMRCSVNFYGEIDNYFFQEKIFTRKREFHA